MSLTWFIFGGDMLVMLFMVIVVTWVSMSSTQDTIDRAARIPLDDERFDRPPDERADE